MDRRLFLTSLAALGMSWHDVGAFTRHKPESETSPQSGATGSGLENIRSGGIREIPVRGGKYKVWTKKVGSGETKVLLLHGGPGASHEYFEAFESFLPGAGIEFYYYDQLGCNNSDQPNDVALWTLNGYLEEVEEVRRGLGLDNFVLCGHSWGGILTIEYALRYPQHLRAIVISNMSASINSYLARINWWKRQLPVEVQRLLDAFDLTKTYSAPEYSDLMMKEVYPRVLCRLQPWPEPVARSLRHLNEQVYVQMQGHSEFLVTGNLQGWDRWANLPQINVPALTIGARYDEMDPADMERMAKLMPQGRYAYCPNGSHFCMWDDQTIYFKHLLSFLSSL